MAKDKTNQVTDGKDQGGSDANAAATYIAEVVIDHDNERYEIGSALQLTDKQAAPLLAVGAIVGQ
jgi:hypothetical protein